MDDKRFYTLSGSCPDDVGITARISGFIASHGGWIHESNFYAENDNSGSRYFMRVVIKASSLPFALEEFRERFRPLADELKMNWRINDSAIKRRVVIMVMGRVCSTFARDLLFAYFCEGRPGIVDCRLVRKFGSSSLKGDNGIH